MALLLGGLAQAGVAVEPLHIVTGSRESAAFGLSIAGVGDVDGDGRDDFVAGESFFVNGAVTTGRATVHSGATGAPILEILGEEAGSRFGYSVTGPGDVDGDGTPDVALGAPLAGTGGVALIVSGADGSTLLRLEGGTEEGLFGAFVGAAGDVDGDGVPDLIVSEPGAGAVTIFSGAGGDVVQRHEGFQGIGHANIRLEARSAGDVDADGVPDLVVGEPFYAASRGRAVVYSGTDGAVLRQWVGRRKDSAWFGYSVAGPGDLDGDGFADVVVGISHRVRFGRVSGQVNVYSGQTGRRMRLHRGPRQSAAFGRIVSAAGDVDGDGVGDYLAGAPYWSGAKGRAFLFSGRRKQKLLELPGHQDRKAMFGYSLSGAGDVDGDGRADLLIGAPGELQDTGVVRVYSGAEASR